MKHLTTSSARVAALLLSTFAALRTFGRGDIYSTKLGTFFDLPEEMPEEVDSENTPGSDPEDGEGWYIDTSYWTNVFVRVSEWRTVGRNRQTTPSYMPMECDFRYYSEFSTRFWDIASVSKWPEKWYDPFLDDTDLAAGVKGSSQLNPAPEGAMSLVGYADRIGYPSKSYYESGVVVTNRYDVSASRTNVYNRVYVVSGHPRSVRFTPTGQSAFNSTFEAYLERQYFGRQGLTNDWSVAEYGPTDARHFKFSSGSGGFSYTPTNRVVNSRRMDHIHVENMFNALDALKAASAGRWTFCPYRPKWYATGSEYTWPFEWSSTATAAYLPNIAWRGTLFGGIAPPNWGVMVEGLGTLSGSAEWPCAQEYNERIDPLLQWVLSKIYLDEPGQDPYHVGLDEKYDLMPPTVISEMTLEGFVQTNYPHSNMASNVLEKSIRQTSHALSAENQILSLLDRTYNYVTAEANYGYYDDYKFSNRRVASGWKQSVHVEVDFSDPGTVLPVEFVGKMDTLLGSDITWGEHDAVTTTNKHRVAYGGGLVAYFDKPVETAGLGDGYSDTKHFGITSGQMDEYIKNNYGFGTDLPQWVEFILDNQPTVGDGLIYVSGTARTSIDPEAYELFYINVCETNSYDFNFSTSVNASRTYRYRQTDINSITMKSTDVNPGGRLNHPSPEAFATERVKSTGVWALSSIASIYAGPERSDDIIDRIDYGDKGNGTFYPYYSANWYAGNSNKTLKVSEPVRVFFKMKELVRDSVGIDPLDDARAVVPITHYDLEALENACIYSNVTVSVSSGVTDGFIRADLTNGSYRVGFEWTDPKTGEQHSSVGGMPNVVDIEATFENGANSETFAPWVRRQRFYSQGYSEYIQQTDWNWKALIRE